MAVVLGEYPFGPTPPNLMMMSMIRMDEHSNGDESYESDGIDLSSTLAGESDDALSTIQRSHLGELAADLTVRGAAATIMVKEGGG